MPPTRTEQCQLTSAQPHGMGIEDDEQSVIMAVASPFASLVTRATHPLPLSVTARCVACGVEQTEVCTNQR